MSNLEVLDEETLHAVIAAQARRRSASELWTTAVGGTTNALLLWAQFPSLHWLAAGFAAVAAYGAWGLVDRQISIRELKDDQSPEEFVFLRFVRGMTAGAGWIAALAAVVEFTNAAVGGLSLPGR